jgi:serine/threonine-protein kinase
MSATDRWIWPFELIEKIGEGGMGVVYKARYVVKDKLFAVKLLPKDIEGSAALARFGREMTILKTLRHPNIVRCFGGVCENKSRFYAMELVEGGTLDELIRRRGRLSWEQVIELSLQISSALEYAHQHSVVHRDIKPGNFLLTDKGQVKLSDFGLATVAASRRITMAGKTVGTYHYMAPEQIRGTALTGQADLYAAGCVMFEMLTGSPPFDGETPAEILQKHLTAPPPRVAEKAPDCPPLLEQLVLDLLAKSPEQRPADAAAMAARLRGVTQSVTVETKRWAGERRVGNAPVGARAELQDTKTDARPDTATSTDVLRAPSGRSVSVVTAIIAALLLWGFSMMDDLEEGPAAVRLWIEQFRGEPAAAATSPAAANGVGAAPGAPGTTPTAPDTTNPTPAAPGTTPAAPGTTPVPPGTAPAAAPPATPAATALDLSVRVAAAEALGKLAPTSEAAAAELQAALDRLNGEPLQMQVAIIEALGEAGYAARGVEGQLFKLHQKHPEPQIRTAAGAAHQQVKNSKPPGRSLTFYLSTLTLLTAAAVIGWQFLGNRSSK